METSPTRPPTRPPTRQWQCGNCGEIYDEATGLALLDIAPGTRFEDLPADFICPSCGMGHEEFSLLEAD